MRILSAAVLALMLAAPAALAADKVALLIGNAAYQHSSQLRSPLNDADAMGKRLEALGFNVETVADADRLTMGRAVQAFGRRARTADTALVFYSGHGMEIGGANYLIPTDARLEYQEDAGIEAIALDDVIAAARGAARLSVVIVDACRNNTFPSSAKSGAKGFRPVQARPGQVIAFATAPGAVAYDGSGALSPYTRALTELLDRAPNADVRRLFTSIGAAVERYAGAAQEPFTRFGTLPFDEVSLTGAAPAARPASQPPATPARPAAAARKPGERFRDCAVCPEMVAIPGGAFLMGSPETEPNRWKNEGPQTRITLRPFALGRTEVTAAEWKSCKADGYCAKEFSKTFLTLSEKMGGDVAVSGATWEQVAGERGFIAWLNTKVAGAPFRLPSEAEWEYAARAGSADAYPWGPTWRTDLANVEYNDNKFRVGGYPANAFGLQDMIGNLGEMTQDCWRDSHAGADPNGAARRSGDCSHYVKRGGDYRSQGGARSRVAKRVEASKRSAYTPTGFRVARDLP